MTPLSAAERATLAAAAKIKRDRAKAATKAAKAARQPIKRDRGRERDSGFLSYLRRQPCAIGRGCSGPVQAAHLRYGDASVGRVNPGLQCKPSDRWATPLCACHHAEQHAGSERAFWNRYGFEGTDVARRYFEAFSKT